MVGFRLGIFIIVSSLIWYWRLESGRVSGLQSEQQVKITSTVSQQPSIKKDKFTGEEYQWVWLSVGSEQFGFRVDRWEEIGYGDRVEIEGKIRPLGNDILYNPLISLKFFYPRRWLVEKAQVGRAESVGAGVLARWRQEVLDLFRRTLPRDEAALLSGMVLGTKGELSEQFHSALQRSGTIHVVVASGFNVMLVAGTLASVLIIWVRRQTAVILGILGIWGYVAIVGFDAPVVRAGIMGSLAFIGIAAGRVRDTGWLLIVSAVFMLWWRPVWLWDVGFQLSFAATAGLIWIEPVLRHFDPERRSRQEEKSHSQTSDSRTSPPQLKLEDRNDPSRVSAPPVIIRLISVFWPSLRTTIAAQIAVMPILTHVFGEISLWSPIANALILWVVPVVTGVGMVAGVLQAVLGDLGSFAGPMILWTIWPLLRYFVFMVQWFGQWGTWQWQMYWWEIMVYYVVLVWIVRRDP